MKKNKTIAIVDYQLGNLFSVNQALVNIGLNVIVSSNPKEIECADAIVLPGVGAFRDAMNNLNELDLVNSIKNSIEHGKPFFGICLGLQLLFNESEEFGMTKGLGIIDGSVKKFNNINLLGETRKVPQISWNQIFKNKSGLTWEQSPLLDIKEGAYFYFVHSYYVVPSNNAIALTETDYDGQKYISSICKDNIFACQFHPEKSAKDGLRIYNNWALINNLK